MEFLFASDETKTVTIYIDPEDTSYRGILHAAEGFASDIRQITGKTVEITTEIDMLSDYVITVGTIGENRLLNRMQEKQLIDDSELQGKWECHRTSLLSRPVEPMISLLCITGSDKRGCIYGLYRLSTLLGVSPWSFWADVVPEKRTMVSLSQAQLEYSSKEPSVKYRGIFINDESPSFTGWAYEKYGGLNDKMYCRVFDLLLRLGGNYLWPAMWGNIFSEEGSVNPNDNIFLADEYGIVMGTSHHEPMCRAGEEWRYNYTKYTDHYDWNFSKNEEGITAFWKDGITRNKDYENVITIGMRGEADSALEGGLKENIDLLKKIIRTQMQILKEQKLEYSSKVFVVYKEVEDYFYGGKDPKTGELVEGLIDWTEDDGSSPMDDTVVMLCDDNYGNVRALPETDRKGGWGMYYHFDYNGGPRGYMWINVMQLEKTWEQLSQTYDYGIQDIWIVNVGDLKPMEMQISYFMDMAFDMDKYGTKATVTPEEYYHIFVKNQFAYAVSEDDVTHIADLLKRSCKLNALCKPEYLREDVYHTSNYGEAERILTESLNLKKEADLCRQHIPMELQDAYYELVYYPVVATANCNLLYIYYSFYMKYKSTDLLLAEDYGRLTQNCIEYDQELTKYYNQSVADGKWNKMMSQPHIGYVAWNAENAAPPVLPEFIQQSTYSEEELNRRILEDANLRPSKDYIAINAENFTRNNSVCLHDNRKYAFQVIPAYGRDHASMKVFPMTNEFIDLGDRMEIVPGGMQYRRLFSEFPSLEYDITVQKSQKYFIRVYAGPSNHTRRHEVKLRYAVAVDGNIPQIVNLLPEGYLAGNCYEINWCETVRHSIHIAESEVYMERGSHTLIIYGIDPGLLLQKVVVYSGSLPESYLGPQDDGIREL